MRADRKRGTYWMLCCGVAVVVLLLSAKYLLAKLYCYYTDFGQPTTSETGPSMEELGQQGDALNIITAIASCFALTGVMLTYVSQREQIDNQRVELDNHSAEQKRTLRLQLLSQFLGSYESIGEELRILQMYVLKPAEKIAEKRGFQAYRNWLQFAAEMMCGSIKSIGDARSRAFDLLVLDEYYQPYVDATYLTHVPAKSDVPPFAPYTPDDRVKILDRMKERRQLPAVPEHKFNEESLTENELTFNLCRRRVVSFWDNLGKLISDDKFSVQDAGVPLSARDALYYFNFGSMLPHLIALAVTYSEQIGNGKPSGRDYGMHGLYVEWKASHATPSTIFFPNIVEKDKFCTFFDVD